MGKIFYIMGKSSSGKDTIYRRIKENSELLLQSIIPYTTRPIRDGETEGVSYHFVNEEQYKDMENRNVIVESRTYHTIHGDWKYFSVNDESINLEEYSYIAIGVLESFVSFRNYYGADNVVPIMVWVDDGERLARALSRERSQENPKYKEMCRRFIADTEDFAEEKIKDAGIKAENRFENVDLDECVAKIVDYIDKSMREV